MFLVNQKPIGRLSADWLKFSPKVNDVNVFERLSTGWSKAAPNVNDVNVFGKPKTDRKIVYCSVETVTKC
jgi:hypothetical protein